MNLKGLIQGRRTIHQYTDKGIDPSLLVEAVELARWAPNHKNTEPCRFYEINSEHRNLFVKMVTKKFEENGSISEVKKEAIKNKFLKPAYLIIVTRTNVDDAFQAKEDYATLACALQNMSLFLWEKGVGTKWGTGPITRHPKTYEALGISAEKEVIEGLIYVGVAEKTPEPPQRMTVDEIFRKL